MASSIYNQVSQRAASFSEENSSFKQSDSTVLIPKTLVEMKEFLQSDHEAVQMIVKSTQAHRSPYQALVFLYGLTGGGKSSTINHLFNTQLIPTSDDRSCTKDVTEYVATMDSAHWNVTDLEIGFVDTPGFGDTESISKDVENLGKIDSFLFNHPFLNSQLITKIYPNIVMIVSSFNDNRMGNFNSQFSKMLRMLSKFDIVDKVRRNVVIVLTNALSIRPTCKYDEMKKRKLGLVDNLSRLHFGVSFPIILIENIYEGLDTHGEWTLLPDGTKQPLNLFDAMTSLMKHSGDEIGIETVRLLFQNRKNIQISDERRLGIGVFKDCKCRPNIPKWEKVYSSEFRFQYETTELNKRIIACVEEKYFPQLSSLSYEMVSPLMRRMQEVNLTRVSDICTKNIEEVNQLLYPFCMNKLERILLFELFKVRPLDFLQFHMLGSGVLPSEKILKFHIISSKELKYCYEIGTHMPENSTFSSKGKLLVHCHSEWGKKIISSRKAVITFSVQYEVFELTIGFNGLTFDQMESSFMRAVSTLPDDVPDHTDKRTTDTYKSFIDKYGTQCVLGVSYGGEINGSIDLIVERAVDKDYLLQLSVKVKQLLWIYFNFLENSEIPLTECSKFVGDSSFPGLYESLLHSSVTWAGGDKKYYTSNLEDINIDSWKCWINSLCSDFKLLENIVHVCPIAALIGKQNGTKANSFQRAVEVSFPREFTPVDSYTSVFKNPSKATSEQSLKENISLFMTETRIDAGESVKSTKSPCGIL